MIDWTQKVITDQGPISLKEMATVYADRIPKDYHNKQYTCEPKTERRIVGQAKSFWVNVKEKFLLMNELGEWKPMEGLYFHGSSEISFKTYFFGHGLVKHGGAKSQIVISTNQIQQILIVGTNKLNWCPVNSLNGIGETFAVLRHPHVNSAEYIGTVKSYLPTQFVSVKAKDSMGVALQPGIIAYSGVSIDN